MKTRRNKLRPRFGGETRFPVAVVPAAPFRGVLETQLERLKDQLLQESLRRLETPELSGPLRRAGNEAAALAWTTAYPLLVFPELFREKALAARHYVLRQANVARRCRQNPFATDASFG